MRDSKCSLFFYLFQFIGMVGVHVTSWKIFNQSPFIMPTISTIIRTISSEISFRLNESHSVWMFLFLQSFVKTISKSFERNYFAIQTQNSTASFFSATHSPSLQISFARACIGRCFCLFNFKTFFALNIFQSSFYVNRSFYVHESFV